jgi:ABC-type cobalt transport system substrate-binding protein
MRGVIIICMSIMFFMGSLSTAQAKWEGIDETVVEKYAEEYGREAVDPLINTDQGDLLLFVFLLAGAIGGFIVGYYARIVFSEQKDRDDTRNTGT